VTLPNTVQVSSFIRSGLLYIAGMLTLFGMTKGASWASALANMETVIGIASALITLGFGQWARRDQALVNQAVATPGVKTIIATPEVARAAPSPDVKSSSEVKVVDSSTPGRPVA